MKKIIYILALMLFVMSSCDKSCHFAHDANISDQDLDKDPDVGVVVGFNTDNVSTYPFDNLHLLIFDQDGKIVRSSYYTDMKVVASEKILLDSGEYTIYAIFNTTESLLDGTLDNLYLSGLVNIVHDLYEDGLYANLLTGSEQVVVESGIEQVIIDVTDKFSLDDNASIITLKLIYPDDQLPIYTRSGEPTLRAVVELYSHLYGDIVLRKVSSVASSNSVDLIVTEGEYDVRVWSDYTYSLYTDLYYDTSNSANISLLDSDIDLESATYKDAFAKELTSVTVLGNQTSQSQEITLDRPLARYSIVATDLEEYNLLRESSDLPAVESLSVEILYDSYLPTAYDMTSEALSASSLGCKLTTSVQDVTETDVLLASDFVLASGSESSVTVTINLYDELSNLISSVEGVTIYYMQGMHTIISGALLTAGKGGIDLDTDWDDDINVNF